MLTDAIFSRLILCGISKPQRAAYVMIVVCGVCKCTVGQKLKVQQSGASRQFVLLLLYAKQVKHTALFVKGEDALLDTVTPAASVTGSYCVFHTC